MDNVKQSIAIMARRGGIALLRRNCIITVDRVPLCAGSELHNQNVRRRRAAEQHPRHFRQFLGSSGSSGRCERECVLYERRAKCGVPVGCVNGRVGSGAGTGIPGYGGDNGLATSASHNFPTGVAVDTVRQPLHLGRKQLPSPQGLERSDHDGRGKWHLLFRQRRQRPRDQRLIGGPYRGCYRHIASARSRME